MVVEDGFAATVRRQWSSLKDAEASVHWMLGHPMGRRSPSRTLYNYLSWQIKSRLRQGPFVVPFVDKSRLLVDRHEHGTTANVYVGLREFESMSLVFHALRPGDVFVDVGANVGTFSVLAAAVAGARVVAVEPVPSTARRLLENVRLNSCDDLVELHQVAAGAGRSRARMIIDAGPINRVYDPKYAADHATAEVDVCPLDDILSGRRATLVKIDVEGLELDVLQGARALLESSDLLGVIVETNGSAEAYGRSDLSVLELLSGYGFKTAAYDPWSRAVVETSEVNVRENTLFLRQSLLAGRVRSARSRKVQQFFV